MPGRWPRRCGFLDSTLCGKVEEKILDRAGEQNVTELKRSLTRAVKAVDPRGWAERHQQAQRRRDVCPSLLPDGMGGLFSTHTAADVDAMMAALQHVADQGRGDGRLVGERRADALRDLVLGRITPPPPAKPVKHRPITIADAYQYEPCPALREKVVRRDQTCRFIGCNRQAITCEIDHIDPYNGSNTVEANLHPMSPPPPPQARKRLAGPPPRRRLHRMDLTHRPDLPQAPTRTRPRRTTLT